MPCSQFPRSALDVSGPLDVFAEANAQAGKPLYRMRVVAAARGPILSSSGARLVPDAIIGDKPQNPSTPCWSPERPTTGSHLRSPPRVLDWVKSTASKARRFGSVCSGAFVLAEAGLLTASASRHIGLSPNNWRALTLPLASRQTRFTCEMGASEQPLASQREWTWLCALVEEDAGRDIATRVAAQLRHVLQALPAGRCNSAARGMQHLQADQRFQEVQRWVAANPAQDHSIEASEPNGTQHASLRDCLRMKSA